LGFRELLRAVKSTSCSSRFVFVQEVGQTAAAFCFAQLQAVKETSAAAPFSSTTMVLAIDAAL
jgi:hypothetical protein